MKSLVALVAGLCLTAITFAQDVQTFSNIKYRFNNYGQFTESSTGTPTRITFDGPNNSIRLETESTDIQAFVDYGSVFTIMQRRGTDRNRTFFTNEGITFQVEPLARRILIYKQGTNIRMSALWLDEIEFE